MEWLSAVAEQWLTTLEWLAGLAAGFAVLSRVWPCNPGMSWWKDRRAVVTDIGYWFLAPLLMLVGRVALLAIAGVLILGGGPPPVTVFTRWPLAAQIVAILLIQDAILYGIHRAFHTRVGWHFHAVHHSPKVLDWTALARFHPVNQLLEFAVADVIVLLMGFPPAALLALAPFNLVYSAMTHANLNWTFGPFRYVLASPVFHRWHHTSEAEGRDKNFASTFPVLDLLFGTFHMPARVPERYGVADPEMPVGFWGQLAYPFRGSVPVRWAERRPALATVAGVLVAAGVLGGWKYVAARFAHPAAQREDEATATPKAPSEKASRTTVTARAATADGRVVVHGDADGTVRVWSAGKLERTDAVGGVITGVAVSDDGTRIVAGFRQAAKVWDSEAKSEVVLKGHGALVACVAISPDGARVATGDYAGCVKWWDTVTGAELASRSESRRPVAGIEIQGSRVLVRGTDGALWVWENPEGTP